MSIRAVTDLATERDRLPRSTTTAQYADILTKTVPTESLAAYTAFVAIIETQAGAVNDSLGWRWAAFGGFIVLTLVSVLTLYYSKSSAQSTRADRSPQRRAPIELLPTMVSAIAWGLAMPGGPLTAQFSGATGVLAVTAVIIGGGALVTVTGIPLKTATDTPGAPRTAPAPLLSRPSDPPQRTQLQKQSIPFQRPATSGASTPNQPPSSASARTQEPTPPAQQQPPPERQSATTEPATRPDNVEAQWAPTPTEVFRRPAP